MKTNRITKNTTNTTGRPSSVQLTRMVKEKALSLGAHLVGIAPIERMDGAPPDLHPKTPASGSQQSGFDGVSDQPWGSTAAFTRSKPNAVFTLCGFGTEIPSG